MDIKEVGNDMMDMLKGNGGKIAIAVGGGVLLYFLISKISGDKYELVTPMGYTSYPDADKNANVIIDSVNKHTTFENTITRDQIDAESEVIKGQIGNLKDHMTEQFESTNGYIKDGFEGLNNSLNMWGDKIIDNTDSWGNRLDGAIGGISGSIGGMMDDLYDKIDGAINPDIEIGDLDPSIEHAELQTPEKGDEIVAKPESNTSINEDLFEGTWSNDPPKKTSKTSYYKPFDYSKGGDKYSIVDGLMSINA